VERKAKHYLLDAGKFQIELSSFRVKVHARANGNF
jgi:hypothetical protein